MIGKIVYFGRVTRHGVSNKLMEGVLPERRDADRKVLMLSQGTEDTFGMRGMRGYMTQGIEDTFGMRGT